MERTHAAGSGSPVTEPARITAALVDFRLHLDDGVEIRLLHARDADTLHDLIVRNRDHLAPSMAWVDAVIDASDTYAFLRAAEKEALEHTAFKAGIWRGTQLLGAVDLHDIDWNNACARIGYWLDRDETGRGIMTQAVRLLTEYAFDALELHRLEIRAQTENHRSRRIPERLGFTLEGVLRDVELLRGRYYDHALYALLFSE
jgi:ribosomal-protein-serine acetyltransferase